MKRPLVGPLLLSLLCFAALAPALGQAPAEVQNLVFSDPSTLSWDPVTGADHYNVYRGALTGIDGSDPARCHGFRTAVAAPTTPPPLATS